MAGQITSYLIQKEVTEPQIRKRETGFIKNSINHFICQRSPLTLSSHTLRDVLADQATAA